MLFKVKLLYRISNIIKLIEKIHYFVRKLVTKFEDLLTLTSGQIFIGKNSNKNVGKWQNRLKTKEKIPSYFDKFMYYKVV